MLPPQLVMTKWGSASTRVSVIAAAGQSLTIAETETAAVVVTAAAAAAVTAVAVAAVVTAAAAVAAEIGHAWEVVGPVMAEAGQAPEEARVRVGAATMRLVGGERT